jgi:hypothetical protein
VELRRRRRIIGTSRKLELAFAVSGISGISPCGVGEAVG